MHNQIGSIEIPQRPSEKAFAVIMQRLSKWVFNRYECETSHFFFEHGSSRHNVLKTLLQKNEFVRIDGKLHFPIRYARQTIGVVTAKESSSQLSLQQQKELNMLFSMMIEPTLKDIERLELAEQMNAHMTYAHPERNLVRFHSVKRSSEQGSGHKPESRQKIRFDLPALIESPNLEESRKLALEIHHESQRYAFVTIDQIDTELFKSFEDFRELGHLTIFIPNLENLTKSQKQFLLSYFQKAFRPQGSPQVVACVRDIVALRSSADSDVVQIANHLSVALIRMNRPFQEFREIGLVNVLFDALSSKRDKSPRENQISH